MNPQLIFFLNLAHQNIQQGYLDAAERALRQAQKIPPKNSEVLRLFGVISAMRSDYEAALIHFDAALRISPRNAVIYSNKGNALKELNQLKLALESYEKAISLNANDAEVYNNKGNALLILERYDAAIESYEKAITLDPNYADAYNGRGNAYSLKGELTKAFQSCEIARKLDGNASNILSSCLGTRIKICYWNGLSDLLDRLYQAGIREGSKTHPFDFLATIDDPARIKELTTRYMLDMHPARDNLGLLDKKPQKQKIRIGYFSGDFINHPVSYLMAGVLETHDHHKFEVFAFSYRRGGEEGSSMRNRILDACDRFIDIGSDMSDKDVATLARELELDIAIDLGGITAHNRPGVFAYRVAPIQISYIGYLGTMGAPYYDYLIADPIIIPAKEQASYSEKIIYLPSYQANDSRRQISEKIFTRKELGLPEVGFIYCCFNNSYKITPSIFDSWMKILLAVEGSILFLYADNEEVKKNLINEADARGILSDRIIFAGRVAREDYLARFRVADLFLDTSPYNAGTTASDALWAGLPVLTYLGRSFSARMCGSLLNAIGLPELVTSSQQEYEDLAISIGRDPERIAGLKTKLAENRLTKPLFNTKLFTQSLELAFTKAYERTRLDLPPDHIY